MSTSPQLVVTDLNNFLVSILSIIRFEDNKEKFIANFFDVCFAKTIAILTEEKNEKNKKEILITVATITDPKIINDFLQNYFGTQEYILALKSGIEKTLEDFLLFLTPMLSQQEKNTIQSEFVSYLTK